MSDSIKTKILYLEDMICANCENVIEQGLSATVGIISAKANYVKGSVNITYDSLLISQEQIIVLIEQLHYHVKSRVENTDSTTDANSTNIQKLLGICFILISLFVILNRFPSLNIFQAFPVAKEGMGYGMLFFIGILTSVHCMAMCGGICLSQCVSGNAANGKGNETRLPGTVTGNITSNRTAWKPSLLYNLGRVISYTVLGGIVGGIGSVISFSGVMKGFVQIFAGIFMVIMGMKMLNLFPGLRKFSLPMPKIIRQILFRKNSHRSPFYIGLLNGFMPCGPLQAMQLYALSTGSPIKGAIAMFLFAAGTVPLLFTFGTISSFLTKKFTSKMLTVSAVLIVLLGGIMFSNGMSLSGILFPSIPGTTNRSEEAASKQNIAVIKDGVQTVSTVLTSGKYEPIIVQKGIPVKWTISAPAGSINGCNNSIVIPQFQLQKDLKEGDTVIEFTPDQDGTIPYSCWMGMIRSSITVVEDIKKADQSAVNEGTYYNDNITENGEGYGANGGIPSQGDSLGAGCCR
jgi:Uncharacterized conserved protein